MNKKDLIERAAGRVIDLKRLQDSGLICLNGSFYPSGVHYPPITMYPPITENEIFQSYAPPRDGLFDIYTHIPFCLTKCAFCHYPVMSDSPVEKDLYLNALQKEMDLYTRKVGLGTIKARSVLVGGGTPTHLSPAQLTRFLEFFTNKLDMSCCTQFNYDVDPLTLLGDDGLERVEILKSFGVGRLTIGVQSLNDDVLKKMNRHHTADDAIKAVERSRRMGFVVNTEYIFGYEGQTPENWIDVMQRAVALEADEIQLYRLKIAPYGDRTGSVQKIFSENPAGFPDVEETILMKQIAVMILSDNGYTENLRRVFSKKNEVFSHYADNQCCKLRDQIGFGLTAFSSLRDRFVLNTQKLEDYYLLLEQGGLPVNRGIIRGADDQRRWALILPLKNREVRKKSYQLHTGVALDTVFRGKIEKLKKHGLLFENDTILALTQRGGFFADEVCQVFHSPDYMQFPESAYAPGELNPYTM